MNLQRKHMTWVVCLIVVLLGVIWFKTNSAIPVTPSSPFLEEDQQNAQAEKAANEQGHSGSRVYVDIKGGVVEPGVYVMSADQRVKDAIEMAGGLTSNADTSTLNLAMRLQDEHVVVVPVKLSQEGQASQPEVQSYDPVLNELNTSDQATIESWPGIGPKKAGAILQYREKNGSFHTTEELLEVDGIGEVTFEKIIRHLEGDSAP
ncbi:hypothetical protein G4V62_00360 [Bacillaceae bacterium SIJ1]|uniref:helix-hairpin-helix domain-containing protein n=1 Tax=Litoribacterium kuwaitense TaxID=1398745 RepID=UPI0013EA4155|nr:helix-hairpin-helix domain-containing protein [Litoribacterium kuwaitense]NGP43490.1 hypothetical protein [Litoribacterium kuwaitense]